MTKKGKNKSITTVKGNLENADEWHTGSIAEGVSEDETVMSMSVAKRIALSGVAVSVALILSYIETLIPLSVAVPGVKIGLANTVSVYLLYRVDIKTAVAVSGLRVVLSSMLFGNSLSLIYAASGALLSMLCMIILKKTNRFSPIGVSVAGAVSHNVGQIIAAIIVTGTEQIAAWFPALVISGTVFGAAVGAVGAILIKNIGVKRNEKTSE